MYIFRVVIEKLNFRIINSKFSHFQDPKFQTLLKAVDVIYHKISFFEKILNVKITSYSKGLAGFQSQHAQRSIISLILKL